MSLRAKLPSCVGAATIGATLLLLLGAPGASYGQGSDAPTWSITPYIWGTTTKLDLSFRDQEVGQGELTFGDLLDKLDAAFMIHAEGGRGQWSVFGDLTYLKISDTNQRPMVTIDSSSEQVFFDAAVAYWPGERGTGLSLYGGLRYTSFDDRFRFSVDGTLLDELRSDNAYYDALIGARY